MRDLIPLLTAAALALIPASAAALSANWPAFRGGSFGHTSARLPAKDLQTKWQADLPGYGQSTPLVWGRKVFLTSTDGAKKERQFALALNLTTGSALWQKEFSNTVPQDSHDRSSRASSTGAVDAHAFYALFDSGDLYALSHQGDLLWKRALGEEYGPFKGPHGYSSSLAISKDALYVLAAHAGPGALVALDKRTGKNLWTTKLDPAPTFSSPLVHQDAIIITRSGAVSAYDTATGRQRWSTPPPKPSQRGFGVPSATLAGNTVLVPCGEKACTYAVDASTGKQLWQSTEASNDFSSPVVHGTYAYLVNPVGALFTLDVTTGTQLATTRLPASCWASALATKDALYFFTTEGQVTIMKPGPAAEIIAEHTFPIEGRLYAATPVEGAILLRTGRRLLKIAKE